MDEYKLGCEAYPGKFQSSDRRTPFPGRPFHPHQDRPAHHAVADVELLDFWNRATGGTLG